MDDRQLSLVQDQVASVLGPLAKVTILDGVQLDGIEVSTTATVISHTLNRPLLGWIVVDQNAAASVYRTDWTSKTITLQASALVTISLWVY